MGFLLVDVVFVVNVWRSNYDPYDTTVYDERYYRERHCELIRQFEEEIDGIIAKRVEKMKKEGLFDE